MNYSLTAFIPAKQNSKRLPNKNHRPFFGSPMNNWIWEEAKKAEIFDCIYISSQANRPPDLCKDGIKIEDVLKYHLENLDFSGDYICVLYPCAYGITAKDIIKSFLQMVRNEKEYCYSVGMLNTTAKDRNQDNGGFYWVKKETFLTHMTFIPKDGNAIQYEAPQVDINNLEDFMEAKLHAETLSNRFRINREEA